METSPVTCRTLEDFYHIDGHTFEKQYKEVLSGFREWDQLDHAEEWLLFPDNIGPRLAIDESSLSNGELYTFVTNRDARTREQSLIAVVAGTKSEDVVSVLQMIDEDLRNTVREVTLDLSDSIRKIVRTAFPKADRVIERFHIQKLACDAAQELRIQHRWDAIQQANDEMKKRKFPVNRTSHSVTQMVTQGRSCLSALDIYCSNLQTNGQTGKNSERLFYLMNIPILRKRTVFVIHSELYFQKV